MIKNTVRAILQDQFERKNAGGGNATTADRDESVRTIKGIADCEAAIREMGNNLRAFVTKASGEMAETGRVSAETKAAVEKIHIDMSGALDRLNALEAKYNRQGEAGETRKSLGDQFVESIGNPADLNRGQKARHRFAVKSIWLPDTKAVVNATGQNQPLVPDMRVPGVWRSPDRRLTIRDLIPQGRTSSNLVQYVRETLFTNRAGPQVTGSPQAASENATKPESDLTFDLQNAAVTTLAHFILASRQVLDDAPMLASYIDGRLMYGLKLEEEDELLNGDGTQGTLNGLFNQASAFSRSSNGTKIDILRRAITQIALQEYDTEFFVLNPVDWEEIELTKDSQGQYILARPESLAPPALWGKPVVATQSITEANWLAGNASQAAQIWDRQDATVEISREDSDNFRKNMVTLLCEERLALTVYRPQAFVKGTW